ncbi:MAG: HD domain-containing phosphohydrolase [Candidatus Sericytochromatia bacterium]
MYNLFYTKEIENIININELSQFFNDTILKKIELEDINKLKKNKLILTTFDLFNEIAPEIKTNNTFVIFSNSEEIFDLNFNNDVEIITEPFSFKKVSFAINKAFSTLKNKKDISDLQYKYNFKEKELDTLNQIGISLSTERDINKLLDTILFKCREITEADSGSLYIVEEIDGVEYVANDYFSNKQLIFKLAQNDTVETNFEERVLNLNKKSISGYVALTGKPLFIADAYNLPEDAEYSHNKTFDETIGYKCKSMLIVPMKNQNDELIGVIQLINKKLESKEKLESTEKVDKLAIEFTEEDGDLVYSLASQASILIDNNKLYYSIRNLFEGFIKASVTAIEARDPTTSGHSERVADLTVGLAKKVDRLSDGRFSNTKFSISELQQIKYASLLHDFGKIGVREDVLIKAKKLYPYELDAIIQRYKYMKKCMEFNMSEAKLNYLLKNEREKALLFFPEIEKEFKEKIEDLDNSLKIILASNEPTVLAQESSEKLKELFSFTFEDFDGTIIPYLSKYELESLSIARGSLREAERLEIESHVTHTYKFLSTIPWTNEFKQVPDIAYSHHEKLDGTGYPRKINSDLIPLPSKMMAISDIYDALTASDRPYKKALPVEKALDILGFEVKAKKLDEDLFKIFVEAKVFEEIIKA